MPAVLRPRTGTDWDAGLATGWRQLPNNGANLQKSAGRQVSLNFLLRSMA